METNQEPKGDSRIYEDHPPPRSRPTELYEAGFILIGEQPDPVPAEKKPVATPTQLPLL